MKPNNRPTLQVERLEDRCTPGGLHINPASIAQLLRRHVNNPLAALQRLENKAIRHNAPQSILNLINNVQARLGG